MVGRGLRVSSDASEGELNRWIEELVGADFGDIRLSERFVRLVEQLSERPESSVLEACGSMSAAKAAYRFWSNTSVNSDAILRPHVQQTARRAKEFPVVLVAQDTTEVNLTSHAATADLGYLGSATCRGIMLHNLLCLSPQGVPLGLVDQFFWARDPAEVGKRADATRSRLTRKRANAGWTAWQPLSSSWPAIPAWYWSATASRIYTTYLLGHARWASNCWCGSAGESGAWTIQPNILDKPLPRARRVPR